MLTALFGATLATTPAFADFSPESGTATARTRMSAPIQLAEANVGSVDDYMHQSDDGPSGSRRSCTGICAISAASRASARILFSACSAAGVEQCLRRPERGALRADWGGGCWRDRGWIVGVAAARYSAGSVTRTCTQTVSFTSTRDRIAILARVDAPTCRGIETMHSRRIEEQRQTCARVDPSG